MFRLVNTIIAAFVVSLLSLIGIFALSLKEKTLHNALLILVAFSAGSILGVAYFDLLPEAVELVEDPIVFVYITFGFIMFFFLERFIYWYHGHGHEADITTEAANKALMRIFAFLNLLGDGIHNFIDGIHNFIDGIHNFIDGMVIAASFFAGFPVGLAATVAVIFHELPQEMGDYGILVYAGFKRSRALLLNFVVALTVVLGGISGAFFMGMIEALSGLLIALSVGGFIYLAASELIPEMQKEKSFKKSAVQFFMFILGIFLIWLLGLVFPE
jgi:zinc and cadmium transporter